MKLGELLVIVIPCLYVIARIVRGPDDAWKQSINRVRQTLKMKLPEGENV